MRLSIHKTIRNTVRLLMIIAFLCAVYCVGGCRSKKSTTEALETSRIDSIANVLETRDIINANEKTETVREIYIKQTIPCDQDQKGEVKSGENTIKYEIKDGEVIFEAAIDSCKSYYKDLYRGKFISDSIYLAKQFQSKQVNEREVIKYVYPWWVWLLGAGCIVLLVLYLKEKTSIFNKILGLFV